MALNSADIEFFANFYEITLPVFYVLENFNKKVML